MSMNFKFSGGYGEYQAVPLIDRCCYSNTHSADMLLRQQWVTGGLECFLR
jgi:hypothetical protein